MEPQPDAPREAISHDDRAYIERRLTERLFQTFDEVARLADERTSAFFVVLGLLVMLFALGWKVLSVAGLTGGLDSIEFIGVLAAGSAMMITGAGIRRAVGWAKRDAVTAVTTTVGAYLEALGHPGRGATDTTGDRHG